MRRYADVDGNVAFALLVTLYDFYYLRREELPEGEDGEAEGYLVSSGPNAHPDLSFERVADGRIKWVPAPAFEDVYQESPFKFDFGAAIDALKDGHQVTRTGWNGKGMFVYYVPAQSYPTQTEAARARFGDSVPYAAYLALVTNQGNVATWTPSITDIFANDWIIYE